MKETIKRLLILFNKGERKKFILLFFMTIMAAIFETLGIGMIVPIVGVVTKPSIIHDNKLLSYVFDLFHFSSDRSFILFAVIMLLATFVFKNVYLLFSRYLQNRVILNQQVKLSRRLFEEYLKKPYVFQLQRNTANLLRNINEEVPKVFQGIMMSAFQLFTESLFVICIFGVLIATAPVPTVTVSILLGGSVILFFRIFRKKISTLGKELQVVSGKVIKSVNQGLGAGKEVKVTGKEGFFLDSYTEQSQIKANNKLYMNILGMIPSSFIEVLMVTVVLLTMLIMVFQETDTTKFVSTMALFVMAAFRLMPSINRVITTITTIKYSLPGLNIVYEDLFNNNPADLSYIDQKSIKINKGGKVFTDSIQLQDVFFRYPNQMKEAVQELSLRIPIGQSIAFVGESGAGKTTIVDIILGLFQPEKGQVLVDGRPLNDQKELWKQKIGYIPQSIYLSDDSIRGNVAFGFKNEQIDDKEVWRALDQAQLKEFVEELPDQLETKVGERGVRLSGGQRQRIGIARALYHNPEILFLDEATSSLDDGTEKEIIKAIDGLKGEKTLIIIAHRLSTIENCDTVFRIKEGRLISVEPKMKPSQKLIEANA